MNFEDEEHPIFRKKFISIIINERHLTRDPGIQTPENQARSTAGPTRVYPMWKAKPVNQCTTAGSKVLTSAVAHKHMECHHCEHPQCCCSMHPQRCCSVHQAIKVHTAIVNS